MPETPLNRHGINFVEHAVYEKPSKAVFNAFLVKNKIIDESFGAESNCGFTVKSKYNEGSLKVTIEPSIKLDDGIYLSFNFSYNNETQDARHLVKSINDTFFDNLAFVTKFVEENIGDVTTRIERVFIK